MRHFIKTLTTVGVSLQQARLTGDSHSVGSVENRALDANRDTSSSQNILILGPVFLSEARVIVYNTIMKSFN